MVWGMGFPIVFSFLLYAVSLGWFWQFGRCETEGVIGMGRWEKGKMGKGEDENEGIWRWNGSRL
jgi:hypothetical protein